MKEGVARNIQNKRKIINDPVYGFINLTDDFIFDLISHSFFQRLRRIKQLGLSDLVYPGAVHTRFGHALGAMHLMTQALEVLRLKGQEISREEEEGALAAILLHDLGHGPFSHSLEYFFFSDLSHEEITIMFMERINQEFSGRLDLAIDIFRNHYHKHFLHQLVSSQIDTDRLDYLTRDSFFTGVSEGIIGTERIIKMLTVSNGELLIDEKGIYSIEKFIISRRLMYWQVYMHKTVVAAEQILIATLKRARELMQKGDSLWAAPGLYDFLKNSFDAQSLKEHPELLDKFAFLSDNDIWTSLEMWSHSAEDKRLKTISKAIVERKLPKIKIQTEPFSEEEIRNYRNKLAEHADETGYDPESWVITGELVNRAYDFRDEQINILYKSGEIKDISLASDQLDQDFLSKTITKHFLLFPKIEALTNLDILAK